MKKIVLIPLLIVTAIFLFGCSKQISDTAYNDLITNLEKMDFNIMAEDVEEDILQGQHYESQATIDSEVVKEYYFEPDVSIIEGTLITRMYYGPPNYGEDPETDAKQYPFILQLDEPIDVISLEGDIHNSDRLQVTEIQVVPNNEEETKNLKKYINKRIIIQGTLFEAIFGSHHMDVLIRIEEVLD